MKIKLLFVAGLLALYSCSNSSQEEKPAEKSTSTAVEEESIPEETEEEVSVIFPSAVDIMTVFKQAGLSYEKGITLPAEKHADFIRKEEKAIALGMYTADLAYCVVNQQQNQALGYIKAVRQVSELLGLSSVYENEILLKRFEQNINNEDSTLTILAEIQSETDMYIEENGLQDLAAVIFAGAWTEGMYLGVEANDDYDQESISTRVVEQMELLDNVVKMLQVSELGNVGQSLLKDLSALQEQYSYFDSVTEAQQTETIPTLSLSELNKLAKQIKTLRNARIQ